MGGPSLSSSCISVVQASHAPFAGEHREATSVRMREASVHYAAQTGRTPTWESAG